MDLVQAIVLAIVQGLSEFLPISSSGHLILIPHFLGWSDQGLAFDVAVHVGTLLALLAYFHRQLGTMATAWLDSVLRRQHTRDGDILLFRNRKRRMSPSIRAACGSLRCGPPACAPR
jgi:undecaprenyl-diphosphatase